MKKIYCFLMSLFTLSVIAQTPQYINYQGVARDNLGQALPNTPLSLTLSIGNPSVVFSEKHNVTTNAMGLFSLKIGNGTSLGPGSFSAINWGAGSYSMQVQLDPGTGAVNLGNQQIASVPYALYAEKAANVVTYSSSPNVIISGQNVIDLSNLLSSPTGTYGSAGPGTSKIPFFNVDIKGRLTFAGEYQANTAGDITGTLDNQTVAKINGIPVSGTTPSNGQVMQFNGGTWGPANIATGGVTNITTTGGITGGPITSVGTISLQPTGVGPGIYGAAPNVIPTFSVDGSGRLFSAGTYTLPAPAITPTYVAGQNINITPAGTVNTISSPTYSISFPSPTVLSITNGNFTNTASVPQPTLVGQNGINVAGFGPSYTLTSGFTGTNTPWAIGGNSATIPGTHFIGTSDNQNLIFKTNNVQTGMFTTTGRFGIGLSAPMNTLSVFGNLSVGSAFGSSTAPPNSAIFQGSVGIGSSAPSTALHIDGANAATTINNFTASAETAIRIHNSNQTNNNFGSLIFSTMASNSSQFEGAKIVGQFVNHTSTAIAGELAFLTRNASNLNEAMRITSNGNVGIGTLTALQRLEVNGNIQVPAVNEYMYSAPKTKYYSVASSDFRPENASIYANNFIVGHLYAIPAGGTINISAGFSCNYLAPLNLPDGATITAVDAFIVDDDFNYNVSYIQLWKVNSPTGVSYGSATSIATAGPSAGQSPNIQILSDNSVTGGLVDNQNFYYYLRFGMQFPGAGTPAQNIRLARVVVTYQVTKTD